MSKAVLSCCILFIGLLTISFITRIPPANQILPTKQANELGFPFDLVSEHRDDTFGTLWQGKVFLPIEHYSKENLISLFQWYAKRHPDKKERLDLMVYTSKENLLQSEMKEPEGIPEKLTSKPSVPSHSSLYDAVFYRQGDGAASNGGENEFFIYNLDPRNPIKKKRVVLKGKDPYATNYQ